MAELKLDGFNKIVAAGGDLGKMSDEQKAAHYSAVCESLGLNPLTQPFAFIALNGKLRMYALKDATEQLRRIYEISISIDSQEKVDDVWMVKASARMPSGRTDCSVGAVPVAGTKGEALANAFMKAETKAKRRVTLSICGLGMLDESEIQDMQEHGNSAVEYPAGKEPTTRKRSAPAGPSHGDTTQAEKDRLVALGVNEGIMTAAEASSSEAYVILTRKAPGGWFGKNKNNPPPAATAATAARPPATPATVTSGSTSAAPAAATPSGNPLGDDLDDLDGPSDTEAQKIERENRELLTEIKVAKGNAEARAVALAKIKARRDQKLFTDEFYKNEIVPAYKASA